MPVIMQILMPQCGLPNPASWPDSANLNMYEDVASAVGPHADDEDMFGGKNRPILILSWSLGGTRQFEVRGMKGSKVILRQPLADGDLLAMEQWTQLLLKHSISRLPANSATNPRRINITWRWLVCHRAACPLAAAAARTAPRSLPIVEPCQDTVVLSDAAWAHNRTVPSS